MNGTSVKVTVMNLVVAYAVLVDASNDCDAVDEVVVAADSWKSAIELMRGCGYRKVPRRPARRTVDDDAAEAAFASPGTVFRKRFGSDAPWAPRSHGGGE
ncbi:hypothetical protein ADK41_12730 [Streptomyces caelestis]|uniref:Uncharacterized protein n=2 Tax=Streptomyces TaxID=1883 RepID=A0A0M8QKL6_9ACTN|nr:MULTISPECIES: hypothetical protein [Streptomyces]KOT40583.1 hypothetical protein ADK41_12730 [Streptomyces caelestis]KOV26852.1 hypothetical protein ADK58_14100 [Streptomyces sp. XY152]